MKNRTYLATSIRGSEYGIPIIKIEMADESFEQTIAEECEKHLPYRLCEFTVNFTTESIIKLILRGFEVIVNLDNISDISKIPRTAKIKLTIPVTVAESDQIAILGVNDDVIFTDIRTDKDVELLKEILSTTLTRARVYVKQPDDKLFGEYQEFFLKHQLPVSFLEKKNG